jgi:hypothetical protein
MSLFGRLGDFPVSSAKKRFRMLAAMVTNLCVCAATTTREHTLTGSAPLVTVDLSPVSSSVHKAAAALFTHLSAGSTAAPSCTASLQQAVPCTTLSGTSTVPQMQPVSVNVPATCKLPELQPASCQQPLPVPNDTALSDAASALLAHLSTVAPVLAPVETALRRQTELPEEVDMEIAGSSLPGKHEPSSAPLPYMRHKLRAQLAFWKSLRAPRQVLNWIEFGFMGIFHSECPRIRKQNQVSCYEPVEQFEFVDSSIRQLLARGVIGVWNPDWGEPRVISPLKVVPKKGNTYRLILDLSKMNKHLRFPRFKYAHINQTREVFEPGDFLFAWDLKDGYWHIDLHPDFWTYMAFEWEGEIYHFAVLPFGCAPACWAFTTVIDVLIAACRAFGLKCLSYIDDGLGGAKPLAEAVRMSGMVRTLFTDAGFALNIAKSHFDPAPEQEFIGYLVNCSLHWGLGHIGYLSPTAKRLNNLSSLALKLIKRWRTVTPREMARVSGFVVSMRPVYDPAALCFTKHIYIWIQSLIDSGHSYDWHFPLSVEARAELQVWIDYAEAWSRKALWRATSTVWIAAQDASDTAVGGWFGLYSGSESVRVGKRTRKGEYKLSQHTVWFTAEAQIAIRKLSYRDRDESSTYREMYGVLFIVKTFAARAANASLLIQCDNQSVYWIIKKGSSNVLSIHALVVELFWLCLSHNIELDLAWIPRELNQWSDDLSKQTDSSDWTVSDWFWNDIQHSFGPFFCDRFASAENALLPVFCSLVHCPEVYYVNAFARDWSDGKSWCHPPVDLIGEVIDKVKRDRAQATVLVPFWPSAWWWLRICPDGRHFGPLVQNCLKAHSRSGLVLGEGDMPRSMRSGCPVWVLDLDGDKFNTAVNGPIAGSCSLNGCSSCDGQGFWL